MFHAGASPFLPAHVPHGSVGLQGLSDTSVFKMVWQPNDFYLDVASVWVYNQTFSSLHEKFFLLTQLRFRERVCAGDHPNVAHLVLSGCLYVSEIYYVFEGISKVWRRVRPSAYVGMKEYGV